MRVVTRCGFCDGFLWFWQPHRGTLHEACWHLARKQIQDEYQQWQQEQAHRRFLQERDL